MILILNQGLAALVPHARLTCERKHQSMNVLVERTSAGDLVEAERVMRGVLEGDLGGR